MLLHRTHRAASSNAPSLGLRTAMELRVLLLLLLCFPGLQAQTPDSEERRWEGSTLYIRCPYTAGANYQQKKVWCRMRDDICEPLVETNHPYQKEVTKGKVRIEDNPTHKTVSITMTNLQAEDSGIYSCASRSRSHNYLPLKTISLSVFKELHRWELDSLSLQCSYRTFGYSLGTTVWCRKEGQTGCKDLVRTDSTEHNSRALQDRILIQDDTHKRSVTITMKKLQAQDTGVYWCAFARGTHLTRIMEVMLLVSKRTQQYTATESGNISVQCLYSAPVYWAVSKAWCKEGARTACIVLVNSYVKPTGYRRLLQKGRVTIQDDSQQGIVTITMEKLQAQDSGMYWCALYEPNGLFRMAEVTLSISEVLAGTTLSGTAGRSETTPSVNTPASSTNENTFIVLSGILSILFILAVISLIILCIRRRKQLKKRGNRQAEDTYDKQEDTAQPDSTERMESPKDDSKDLKYVAMNFRSRLNPGDPLYCNVEPSQAHRKPKDENVEYATIAFK
ncbi:polymeric immunoglobulin receptor-like [Falco cherrug]|uniref:polymeric immunoglobulin receptor-like n=1 Tax=Falco cherrug TaxID=345164 RepID=UPI00247B0961|nr:polymeric immunoglobulin receptor-like [Falco cherrug]